jgi:3-mercaptopyruvate sulfurtransferase SseA
MAQYPGISPLPALVLIVGVFLLVGGSLVYLLNRPEADPAVVNTPAVVESDIPYPEVVRVSVEEAEARLDAGTAVLLDVRPREDYETLHAAGAVSIPLAELPGRAGELPQDAEILTYCT